MKSLTYHLNIALMSDHSSFQSIYHLLLLLFSFKYVRLDESRYTSYSNLESICNVLVGIVLNQLEMSNVLKMFDESSSILSSWYWHRLTHVDVDHLIKLGLQLGLFPSSMSDCILLHLIKSQKDWMQSSVPRSNIWPIILLLTHHVESVLWFELLTDELDILFIILNV